MAADSDARAPAWVVISTDPPAVLLDGAVWLVCPLRGFDCARTPQQPFGEAWGMDVLAVHVAIHHRTWH